MSYGRFRVIVIGGGHAGVEAAWAAANLLPASEFGAGAVALVTIDPSKIGVMSCNPAIGGLAKGQLVREIDAMGGLMGLAADATGIHFKVLNTSKGPAVRGPRCQNDKHAYAEEVRRLIAGREEIRVVGGVVEELAVEDGRCVGVVVTGSPGSTRLLSADAVVLTTGTFMRGLMHTGETRTPGGRHGEAAASTISAALRGLGFELGRLKTGTPPRLRRGTIDWEALPEHPGDERPQPFSDLSGIRESAFGDREEGASERRLPKAECRLPLLSRFPLLPQVDCRQTHTTGDVHRLIRENLHRAPMFSGQIESVGPRYCPSIEDKVVRFADREQHGVYLEPESLRDDWVYCNGISTSLPADVQDAIVRGMPGCERAEILRYGYAVEYDMVLPHQIHATGEAKLAGGLFLAGQINGTSGYEEAAAQGLVAGINAARRARGEGEFVLGRDQAYIGVLMDDLVTKTPREPYRMFTSRAEHRLLLRADNAADRLTPVAESLGLLGTTALGRLRLERFRERRRQAERLRGIVDAGRVPGGGALEKRVRTAGYTERDLAADAAAVEPSARFREDVVYSVWADRRYEHYVKRALADIRRAREMEPRRVPEGVLREAHLAPMRAEARQALLRFRPATFGQASRLEGMTPADMTLLSVLVEKSRRAGAR